MHKNFHLKQCAGWAGYFTPDNFLANLFHLCKGKFSCQYHNICKPCVKLYSFNIADIGLRRNMQGYLHSVAHFNYRKICRNHCINTIGFYSV